MKSLVVIFSIFSVFRRRQSKTVRKIYSEENRRLSAKKTAFLQDYFSTLIPTFQGLFYFLYSLLTNLPFSVIIIMCENMREGAGTRYYKTRESGGSLTQASFAKTHAKTNCRYVAERRFYGKTKLEGLAIHIARRRILRSIFGLSLDRRFDLLH